LVPSVIIYVGFLYLILPFLFVEYVLILAHALKF